MRSVFCYFASCQQKCLKATNAFWEDCELHVEIAVCAALLHMSNHRNERAFCDFFVQVSLLPSSRPKAMGRKARNEGPKRCDHPFVKGGAPDEAKQSVLDRLIQTYGECTTVLVPETGPVQDVTKNFVVVRRAYKKKKASFEGEEGVTSLWVCKTCLWHEKCPSHNRALAHKLGPVTHQAWLDSGPLRPRREPCALAENVKKQLHEITRATHGNARVKACEQLLPQETVASLAMTGVTLAKTYCSFQMWDSLEEAEPGGQPLNLERAKLLEALEIVETQSSFSRANHPRRNELLAYVSSGAYKGAKIEVET